MATDALGRRISKNGEFYSYNERSELTGAVNEAAGREYGYKFDDIGNRESAFENSVTNRYAANALNQYSAVDDFTPQYDDDGNQTLVKTATGIWQVSYNGENRPVQWRLINSPTPNSSTPTLISMSFDRMGRRVAKNNQRFVYDGYLCIKGIENTATNHYSLLPINCFVWDPMESVATRPLVWNHGGDVAYYAHDGNKNVSDVVASNGDIVAHYDYAPFGAVIAQSGALASANPFGFSSEYDDRDLGLVYYNYRHYDPVTGRWTSRDPIEERGGLGLYAWCANDGVNTRDHIGFTNQESACPCGRDLVYIANSDNDQDENGFIATAKANLRGDDGTYHDFSNPADFNPNSQLDPGECVCSLVLAAHGYAQLPKVANGYSKVDVGPSYLLEGPALGRNNSDISNLFGGVKFCPDCTIELLSCYLGRQENLKNTLESMTGCKVKTHRGRVYADGSEDPAWLTWLLEHLPGAE